MTSYNSNSIFKLILEQFHARLLMFMFQQVSCCNCILLLVVLPVGFASNVL